MFICNTLDASILQVCSFLHFSWQNDELCKGTPYPKVFDEVRKTLSNSRAQRYGKAPTNGDEVIDEFKKEHVSDAYAFSLLQDHGPFLNDVIITDAFENIIFSSSKSIQLILQNTKEEDRFFIVDGTFRITPNGIWTQVLIVHINFGIKVS